MMSGDFRLPDDGYFRILNFSGGRSSGYMLYRTLKANGGEIPADLAAVLFCNTGKERPETLDFVQECGASWGVPIVWLEYRFNPGAGPGKFVHDYAVVDHRTASRDGRPFDDLIEGASILPNPVMRKCTSELKVRTVERYVRRWLGIKPATVRNVLGLRYDEPKRWKKRMVDGCDSDFPMVLAKVHKAEVLDFWSRNNFDLGIPDGCGNCNYCFEKGKGGIVAQMRYDMRAGRGVDPWWKRKEGQVAKLNRVTGSLRKPEMAQFLKDYSYGQLQLIATSNEEIRFEGDVDCYCGN